LLLKTVKKATDAETLVGASVTQIGAVAAQNVAKKDMMTKSVRSREKA